MFLAADIGGTNARFALFDGDRMARRQTFRATETPRIEDALSNFLSAGESIEASCLAIAGPIAGRVCSMTNLSWRIDADAIEQGFSVGRVALLNDFEAVVWGLDALEGDRIERLQRGGCDPKGARVVLGAGTGLGKAVALRTAEGLKVLRSEGGHADFAPRDDREVELLRFLRDRLGRVSIENVVSGVGLVSIYEFLTARDLEETSSGLKERIVARRSARLISENAQVDAACAEAIRQFVSLYGAAAGNFALEVLPTGGFFVAGGIAPKIIDHLRGTGFMEAFRNKPPMEDLLASIEVNVVLDVDVGLRGAARKAADLLRGAASGT